MKRRLIRGMTLVETLTAAVMTSLVFFGASLALIAGTQSWLRGQSRIDAEAGAQRAMRVIIGELRRAMAVTVNPDGSGGEVTQGISYRLPRVDAHGNYVTPAEWDGVSRTIEFVRRSGSDTGVIRMVAVHGGTRVERVIARHVILTDPLSEGSDDVIRVFTPGPGTIIRQMTVTIATRTRAARDETVDTRIRETVYLRNIPSLVN
jgi:hypothetical protein